MAVGVDVGGTSVRAGVVDADGTVYVTQRGREDDDFGVYVYKSADFGRTFSSLAANLPAGSVNVIREDPRNPEVLYLGTDFGAFMSVNGGREWQVLELNRAWVAAHRRVNGSARTKTDPTDLVAIADLLLAGRGYGLPEDFKPLVEPVCGHRILLYSDAQLRGVTAAEVLDDAVRSVPVPLPDHQSA